MLDWWYHKDETNKFKTICRLCDKEVLVTNNGCFALMQHTGMKSHKEKVSVRLGFAIKIPYCRKKEKLEPLPSTSSEQSRTEIQCSETLQEGTKKVSIKDFYGKTKTNRPTSDGRQET